MNPKITSFNELEQESAQIIKSLNLSEYLIPSNLNIEKQTFLERYQSRSIYNPQFEYQVLHVEADTIEAIKKLQRSFGQIKDECEELVQLYVEEKLEGLLRTIHFYSLVDRNEKSFVEWLNHLYSPPSDELLKQAESELSQLTSSAGEEQSVSPKEMVQHMQKALIERNFHDWSVVIKPMIARIAVNPNLKTINISETAKFEKNAVKRLIVHEVDTHVRRSVNGSMQPYLFMATGMEAMETEEGLAALAEQVSGVSETEIYMRNLLRLICCSKSSSMSFYELFEYALPYMRSENKAFDLVARVKRGLGDTTQAGGWLKDQVYFAGLVKMKQLSRSMIEKLFIGKISLEQLALVDKLKQPLNYNYIIPEWIQLIP